MTQPDFILALRPVSRALNELQVPFYIGGSVASSFHGAVRSTMEVDIVADLSEEHVYAFLQRLGNDYYFSEPTIRTAIARKSSFNLIHLNTSFKVDIFANRERPFDKSAFSRATPGELGDSSSEQLCVPIATAEDTIIAKLEWYRAGNEVSERQWNDVSTVLRLLGDNADIDYLRRSAAGVEVADLLDRLLMT